MRLYTLVIGLLAMITGIAHAQKGYRYDEQGRLIADLDEQIESIEWNNQNKIVRIVRIEGSLEPDLEFAYDVNGNRMMKVVKPRNELGPLPQHEWKYTYYLTDDDGKNVTITRRFYEKISNESYHDHLIEMEKSLSKSVDVGSDYNPVLIARSTFNTTLSSSGIFQKIDYVGLDQLGDGLKNQSIKGYKNYPIRSYLGNIHVVVTDRLLTSTHSAELTQATDYYPYGMTMPSRYFSLVVFRYGYQSSEDDLQIYPSMYTTYYRMLDARLARWWSLDPKENYSFSPYVAMNNNPIRHNDPLGDEVIVENFYATGDMAGINRQKAMEDFAMSKAGRDFLKDFAKKGQTIYGITYNQDGKYHQKGINLRYRYKSGSYDGGSTETEVISKDNKVVGALITVNLHDEKKDTQNAEMNFAITLVHESFIHVKWFGADFLDDTKFNYSNISDKAKKSAYFTSHYHHRQEILDYYKHEYQDGYEKSTRLWPAQAYHTLLKLQKDLRLKISPGKLKEILWDYNGGISDAGVARGD